MVDNATMGKLLERFAQGVAAHDRENPDHNSWGIGMAHFDIERLGLEEGEEILPGIVLQADGGVTGNFRVLCDGQHDGEGEMEEEEVVDAVASEEIGEPVYVDSGGQPPPVRPRSTNRSGRARRSVEPGGGISAAVRDPPGQPLDRRAADPVAGAGAQHRAGDRVQLRLAAGGDVALHRGAQLGVGRLQLGDRRRRLERGALGGGDARGLGHGVVQRGAPPRIRAHEPQRAIRGARGQRQRAQAHQLGPRRLGSESPVRTAMPAPSSVCASAMTSGREPAMSIRHPGLVCTISPGRGRSDSIRITPATTRSWPKRSRSTARCSTPLSSGTMSPGAECGRCCRPESDGLGGHQQHVDRFGQLGDHTGVGDEVAQRGAAHAHAGERQRGRRRLARHEEATLTRARASAAATKPPTPPGPSTAIEGTVSAPAVRDACPRAGP